MRVKLEQSGDLPDFEALIKSIPELNARILGYIGKEAAVELGSMMETGAEGIKFRDMVGNRKSRGGRRMVTYSIGKGLKWVSISSFPLNLFEGGRMLRSGVREPARNIIRGRLKSNITGRLSSVINSAEKMIVDDWFNEKAKGGLRQI